MPIVSRARGVLLAAGCVLAVAANAQAANTLQWKFKEGESFDYAMKSHQDMMIEANGAEIEVTNTRIFDIKWNVKSVDADGAAEVTQTIERIQLNMSTPFTGEFAWDSKSEEEPAGPIWEQMGPTLKAMLGQPITMKISAAGVVSDIALPEELTKALGEGGGRMQMLGGGLSEDMVKGTIKRAVAMMPTEAVEADKTWSQELETKLGPLGVQRSVTTYTYQGTEEVDGKSLAKIDVKVENELALAEDSEVDIELEITEQEASGTLWFDAAAGRLATSKVVQKMTMEGAAMGNEFVQDMEETTIVQLGTSDNLPADEEEKEEEEEKEDEKEPVGASAGESKDGE